jgi:hypothetical protein
MYVYVYVHVYIYIHKHLYLAVADMISDEGDLAVEDLDIECYNYGGNYCMNQCYYDTIYL